MHEFLIIPALPAVIIGTVVFVIGAAVFVAGYVGKNAKKAWIRAIKWAVIVWLTITALLALLFFMLGYVPPITEAELALIGEVQVKHRDQIVEIYDLMIDYVSDTRYASYFASERDEHLWQPLAFKLAGELRAELDGSEFASGTVYGGSICFETRKEGYWFARLSFRGGGRYTLGIIYYPQDEPFYDSWKPLGNEFGWYYYTTPRS